MQAYFQPQITEKSKIIEVLGERFKKQAKELRL